MLSNQQLPKLDFSHEIITMEGGRRFGKQRAKRGHRGRKEHMGEEEGPLTPFWSVSSGGQGLASGVSTPPQTE